MCVLRPLGLDGLGSAGVPQALCDGGAAAGRRGGTVGNAAAHLGNFFPHTVHSCILLFFRFFFRGTAMSLLALGSASGVRGTANSVDSRPLAYRSCASVSLPPPAAKCTSVSDVCVGSGSPMRALSYDPRSQAASARVGNGACTAVPASPRLATQKSACHTHKYLNKNTHQIRARCCLAHRRRRSRVGCIRAYGA